MKPLAPAQNWPISNQPTESSALAVLRAACVTDGLLPCSSKSEASVGDCLCGHVGAVKVSQVCGGDQTAGNASQEDGHLHGNR